jgi:hypothetical protein
MGRELPDAILLLLCLERPMIAAKAAVQFQKSKILILTSGNLLKAAISMSRSDLARVDPFERFKRGV